MSKYSLKKIAIYLFAMSACVLAFQNCGSSGSSANVAASDDNGPSGDTGGDDSGGTNGGSTNGGSNGGGTTPPLVVDLSFCDNVTDVTNGRLCAIKPSKTDSNIQDFKDPSKPNVQGAGFGFHAIGVPKDWNKIKGVWIHFGGSFGNPYLSTAGYASSTWINEILAENYLLVQVAYDNKDSLNQSICPPGVAVDNCSALVRKEVIEGTDQTTLITVNASNGIYNRLAKLASYLQAQELTLPASFQPSAVDWSEVIVSGHSQGSGHAYYLAKTVGVKFACLLSGPYDNADNVKPNPSKIIADWFLVTSSQTPINNIGAFLTTTDSFYNQFTSAYSIMGLTKNIHWFEGTTTYSDGHGAGVGDPAQASGRALACLARIP